RPEQRPDPPSVPRAQAGDVDVGPSPSTPGTSLLVVTDGLHALRTLVFRSRIAWLRRFQGPGNASRKPETTVTEATTAGRGDNCGEVHNGRGRVGPRGLTKSSPLLH